MTSFATKKMAYLQYYHKRVVMTMTDDDRKSFANAVTDVVRLIPAGRATSYGAIARAVGYPNLSRMVGRVMANLPEGNGIPAHRVVNSQGQLTARSAFGQGNELAELLAAEGIGVENNAIKNWKSVFWDPLSEINIG